MVNDSEVEFQHRQAWHAVELIAGATVPAVVQLYSEMTRRNTVMFNVPELVPAAEGTLDSVEERLRTDPAWSFQVKSILELYRAESSGYTFAKHFGPWIEALLRDTMWRTPLVMIQKATDFKRNRDRYPPDEQFRDSPTRTFVAAFDALGFHLSYLSYVRNALEAVGPNGVWSGIANRLERLDAMTIAADLGDYQEAFLNSLWGWQEENTTRRWIRHVDSLVTREEVSEVLSLLYSPEDAARMYTEYVRVADFKSPLTYG